ncbi:MAG: response regulator [Vulcanimicrobiota bacterium]
MDRPPFEILLVEDSPTARLIAGERAGNTGQQQRLNAISDGLEALEYLRQRGAYARAVRPDLILLDLNLPGKSGRELLAELKADPQLQAIPVVAMTTKASEKDILTAYQHHANSYITKPVDIEQYRQTLDAISDYWFRVVTLPPVAKFEIQPPSSELAGRAEGGLRILLVEDSVSDQLIFRRALEAGLTARPQLVWAQDLTRAERYLTDSEFDLIVTDLGLPESNGLETLRRLQRLSRSTPFLVLTGLEDELLGQTAVREGAQDYLVKDQMTGRAIGRAVGYAIERAQMQAQLRHSQRIEAVGQLAGGVAHDFNNLLTIILGHAQALSNGGTDSHEATESVQEILSACGRGADLTRQLLTFSRRQRFNPAPLDLNVVIADRARVLRRLMGENILMEVQLCPQALMIQADLGMIEQVLTNLAVNARDAMAEGGRLRLETSMVHLPLAARPGSGPEFRDLVRLEVSDTGCGIAPENLARVFDPFFTTKDIGRGTGLGLATVHSIIEQHSGWVELTSVPGQGTSFMIYLPFAPVAHAPKTEVGAPVPVGKGEIILVVEDEERVRRLAVRSLQRNGYEVLQAGDGPQALEILRNQNQRVDLMFTDMMMPGGLGGRELALQAGALRPQLPVLYTSGYSPEFVSPQLRLEDGHNFLQKPYSAQRLLLLIRGQLSKEGNFEP